MLNRVATTLDQVNRKLGQVRDVKQQRLRLLNRQQAGAYNWIQRNGDRFRGRVYGPIMAEVNLKDNQYVPVFPLLPLLFSISLNISQYLSQSLSTSL